VKIPFLSDEEIERRAARTLENALADSLNCDFPLDVEALAEFHLDYELSYTSQLPPGIDGETDWTLRTIRISDGIKLDGRCRFTIAHEIGHVVLHVPLFIAQEQQTPIFASAPSFYQDKRLEIQADKFASSLLMPRDVLIELYQGCSRPNGLITAEEVAETFGASRQAARIRLETLGLLSKSSPGQRLDL